MYTLQVTFKFLLILLLFVRRSDQMHFYLTLQCMCVNPGRGYIWGCWGVYLMTHVGSIPVGWVSVSSALCF